MNIHYGNGTTQFGPGVSIELDGEEVATAIAAYLVAHGVHVAGPRTIRVNKQRCEAGSIYVDPSGFVITPEGKKMSGRGIDKQRYGTEPPASHPPVISTAHAPDPVRSAPITAEPPTWARHLAAQAWCTPATSHITMDPVLADAFAAILAEDARCGSQCSSLRAQLNNAHAALRDARPWVVECAGGHERDKLIQPVLARIDAALSAPSGTSANPCP